MGAWGYKAFDNDHALDWASTVINDDFWGKIKNSLEGNNYDEIRAAAGITISVLSGCRGVTPYGFNILRVAHDALKRVLNDIKWLDEWDNPEAVRSEIKQQMNDLQKINPATTLSEVLTECDNGLSQ
jgi:hypothetical protein